MWAGGGARFGMSEPHRGDVRKFVGEAGHAVRARADTAGGPADIRGEFIGEPDSAGICEQLDVHGTWWLRGWGWGWMVGCGVGRTDRFWGAGGLGGAGVDPAAVYVCERVGGRGGEPADAADKQHPEGRVGGVGTDIEHVGVGVVGDQASGAGMCGVKCVERRLCRV